MITLVHLLTRCARGATAVEYGLIISLIVITIVGGVKSVGGSVAASWAITANKVAAVEPDK